MNKFFALILIVVYCSGCGSPDGGSGGASAKFKGEYPIQSIATVGMVADIVRNVGGDKVEVKQLCGSGVDPHLFKATRDDVQAIMSGDIVFYCGLMLEGKMSDALVKVARKKPVIAVTEIIDESYLIEPEDMEGHQDPHVWMDVSAWSKCVDAVARSLAEFDPKNAEQYKANADAYNDKLAALHEYGKKSIASIPEGSRVLVTSHDAFNYMGSTYGLEVKGVQGISTESEAGLQQVNDLVKMLVDKDVKAVFIESSVPRKSIDALVEGARAQGHEVIIGGELYSDAMGQAGTYRGTYIGMLDHNITTVTRALGGEAPEKGFQDKLEAHGGVDE